MKSRLRMFCGALLGLAVVCGLMMSPVQAGPMPVYVQNQPFTQSVNIANRLFVPFAEFCAVAQFGWELTSDNVVKAAKGTSQGSMPTGDVVTLQYAGNSTLLQCRTRNGELYVPLKETAEALGFTVNYSEAGYVDVIAARPINDKDRFAAAAIEKAQAEREEAKRLAAEKAEAERLAAAEAAEAASAEESAAAEDGSKDKAKAGKKAAKGKQVAEGGLPEEFSESADAAKKSAKKAPRQLRPGEIATIENLQEIQGEIDAEANAESLAARKAKTGGKVVATADEPGGTKAAAKKDVPAVPHLILGGETAVADFEGHIVMTAVVRNVGTAPAEGVTVQMVLYGPDGSVWRRQAVSTGSIAPAASWTARYEYNHLDGSSMERGTLKLNATATCRNSK